MGNKGLEERLLLLERKAASDQKQKEKEIQSKLAERETLEEKIHSLQSRIHTLIALADKCVDLGIKFPSENTTYKYGFDSSHPRGFIADGISHYLGFYNLGHKDTYLAILNGGYNGPVDFLTNGTIITGRSNRTYDNGTLRSARNEDMKKFIKSFDEFESAFLKWIDSLSVPEDQNSTDKFETVDFSKLSDTIVETFESDLEENGKSWITDSMSRLLKNYQGDYEREIISDVFVALTGYRLHSLLELSKKR